MKIKTVHVPRTVSKRPRKPIGLTGNEDARKRKTSGSWDDLPLRMGVDAGQAAPHVPYIEAELPK